MCLLVYYPPPRNVEAFRRFTNCGEGFGSERHPQGYDAQDPIRVMDREIECWFGSEILPNNESLHR